jgi:phage/plasmid-associated DNA primase
MKELSMSLDEELCDYAVEQSKRITELLLQSKGVDASSEAFKKIDQQMTTARQKIAESKQYRLSAGNTRFQEGVIKYMKCLFKNDEAINNLNNNKHLFAFNDLVYDSREKVVRPIKPEDCISLTTGYPYPTERDENIRKEIEATIATIFDCPEDRDYLLTVLAACMHGNRFELFHIFLGPGGNGKGLMMTLANKAFGNYSGIIKMDELTKARQSSNQHGDMASMKGKRLVSCGETEEGERFQIGHLKSLSGNDEIRTRAIYSSSVSFVPQFTLICHMNSIQTWRLTPVSSAGSVSYLLTKSSSPQTRRPSIGSSLRSVVYRIHS